MDKENIKLNIRRASMFLSTNEEELRNKDKSNMEDFPMSLDPNNGNVDETKDLFVNLYVDGITAKYSIDAIESRKDNYDIVVPDNIDSNTILKLKAKIDKKMDELKSIKDHMSNKLKSDKYNIIKVPAVILLFFLLGLKANNDVVTFKRLLLFNISILTSELIMNFIVLKNNEDKLKIRLETTRLMLLSAIGSNAVIFTKNYLVIVAITLICTLIEIFIYVKRRKMSKIINTHIQILSKIKESYE